MDPLSIPASCVTIATFITKLSVQAGLFVREIREARNDVTLITQELVSLKLVLELLAEDAKNHGPFSSSLEKQILGILTNCSDVVSQVEQSLQKHSPARLKTGVEWTLTGRGDMQKLRSSLEAHKSALDIALDMIALSITHEIKADTQQICADSSEIKRDTTKILEEIVRLQAQLPQTTIEAPDRGYVLQTYLDNLTTYAETARGTSVFDLEERSGDASSCEQVSISSVSFESPKQATFEDMDPKSLRAPSQTEEREGQPTTEDLGSLGSVALEVRRSSSGLSGDQRVGSKDIAVKPPTNTTSTEKVHSPGIKHGKKEEKIQVPNFEAIKKAFEKRVGVTEAQGFELDESLESLIRASEGSLFHSNSVKLDFKPGKIRSLLSRGADPNFVSPQYSPQSSMLVSAVRYKTPYVRILLEYGAKAYTRDQDHCSYCEPLETAIYLGHWRNVQLLIDAGACPHGSGDKGSPLIYASGRRRHNTLPMFMTPATLDEWEENHLNILRTLVGAGADMNAKGGAHNYTALHKAARYGELVTIRFLLQVGASTDILVHGFGSALHCGVARGDENVVELLLAHFAKKNLSANCKKHFDNFPELSWRKRHRYFTPVELVHIIYPRNDAKQGRIGTLLER